MLEGPGPLAADERDLLSRACAWPEYASWSELTQPALQPLPAERGPASPTALLSDRLRRSREHGPFIQRIDELLTNPPAFSGKMDVLLAVAPGAYYQEL